MSRLVLAPLIALVGLAPAHASPSSDTPSASSVSSDEDALAAALARLRGEVEALSDDVQGLEASQRERRVAAVARRAELESEKARAAQRVARLEAERARRLAESRELDESEARLTPAVEVTLAALDDAIAQGLPFKTEERHAAVADIRDGLATGSLPPRQALLRTWSLVQDEDRLTRENALARQTLVVDGEELHVEVARLGMTLMYFRATDGRTGVVTAQGARTLTDPEDAARVRALFDALGKQIRTGAFELPVALPEVAR